MPYYIYLLECADNSLYCGFTTDLNKRLSKHNQSKTGAKYTRARRPVKLVYYEEFNSKNLALQREREIKKLKKVDKRDLVYSFKRKKTPSNF